MMWSRDQDVTSQFVHWCNCHCIKHIPEMGAMPRPAAAAHPGAQTRWASRRTRAQTGCLQHCQVHWLLGGPPGGRAPTCTVVQTLQRLRGPLTKIPLGPVAAPRAGTTRQWLQAMQQQAPLGKRRAFAWARGPRPACGQKSTLADCIFDHRCRAGCDSGWDEANTQKRCGHRGSDLRECSCPTVAEGYVLLVVLHTQ